MHISMVYVNPGDEVAVPNPGYPTYFSNQSDRRKIRYYDLTEKKMAGSPTWSSLTGKDLSRVKIMWINYPHMPTGAKIRQPLKSS